MKLPTSTRRRLSADDRLQQIVAATERVVIRLGHVPFHMDDIASEAAISRAMLYNYFRSPVEVLNAVVDDNMEALERAGLHDLRSARLGVACEGAADVYLRHVAQRGPALQIILREAYMRGRLRPAVRVRKDRMLRVLAVLARRELKLSIEESLAAVSLGVTIPEIAGRMVYDRKLDMAAASDLCVRLVQSSLDALKPAKAQ